MSTKEEAQIMAQTLSACMQNMEKYEMKYNAIAVLKRSYIAPSPDGNGLVKNLCQKSPCLRQSIRLHNADVIIPFGSQD